MTDAIAVAAPPRASLVTKFAQRFGVEPGKMLDTLKQTAFKTERGVTNEQMMALMIVADQHGLNPFTKEIYAFPDKGGIVPVVSIDGWARIINEHPMLDGIEFEYHGDGALPDSITCVIWRKDRQRPIRVTEFMSECKRGTQPWNSHPRRMLRHKALIQCARIAFGFAGIYDEDEARRIVAPGVIEELQSGPPSASADKVSAILRKPLAPDVVDAEPVSTPDPEAPAWDFPKFKAAMTACHDADAAGVILDEAAEFLNEEEQQQLTAIYRDKFNPSEP